MNRSPSISPKLPAGLARLLDQVRTRHLALTLAGFPIYLLATIAIAWSLQGIADRVFDLSWGARCVLLLLDTVGMLWLVARLIVRPWMQRLDRKAAALLVERGIPEFRSSLISAVELSEPGADVLPQSRPLVEHLLNETSALAKQSDIVARVLPPDRLKKFALRMSLPVVAAVALLVAGLPASGLLLKRILLSRENFPAETVVVAVTGNLRVDEGGDATLTARAQGVIPTGGKLVITRGSAPVEVIPVAPVTSGGNEFSLVVRNIREPFTYHFELNDGVGAAHEMSVHYPPVVKELRFTQIYPSYTRLPETVMSPTALKLLEGSTLRIEGTGSKELHAGVVWINGAPDPVNLTLAKPGKTAFRADLTVPAAGWKSLSVHIEGAEQDGSINDPEYPLQIERDKPPSINLTLPKDEMVGVLMNSTVPISFEVADDYGFSSVTLSYQVFRPLADGNTEQAESGSIPFKAPDGIRLWKRAFDWNLARLVPAVPMGGNIVFWIEVADNNGGPAGPSSIRSPEKTIRVVSEEQKRLELLERMAEKAAEIEQLYEQQRSINGRTESAIQ
jgi:hypothetical protein